ncbi:hypothetical protein IFM89_031228 [Coptis chinensis]|uniref:KNTC1 first ARM-repeats domain-containing protein n=1 Tax=Coptis chinensis TaxID=261450 RepID=A0A835IRA3_9MAGN|nr:hypothetical protein IFM89_031228 [Coptis chinensis]
MQEECIPEVFYYKTIHHITRPFSSSSSFSNYQQKQEDGGVKGGLLSMLSVKGQNRHATFTLGALSDSHDVLGAVDDSHTLYFIKPNGEEIERVTKSKFKIFVPIVGLAVLGDPDAKTSCMCTFIVPTSDGLLNQVEVGQKTYAHISSMLTSSTQLSPNKKLYRNVMCFDYCPEFSLLVVVGIFSNISGKSSDNAEFCCLSVWHIKGDLDVDLVSFSPQLEGFDSTLKGCEGPLTTPKVVISPQSKCIAALDSTGGLDVFELHEERSSLSIVDLSHSGLSQTAKCSIGKRKFVKDITDFTWWSDRVLIIAKVSGVDDPDIFTGKSLLEDDPKFCMLVLQRVQQCQGCVLLMELSPSEKVYPNVSPEVVDDQDKRLIFQDKFSQLDFCKLSWSLYSFLKKSVEEMYEILIANQQYQDALDFAHQNGLDKDGIFKSQWLCSAQGADDVNMFLSSIKDEAFVLSECVDKVGTTEEAVKTLLAYGLKITDKYSFLASEAGESSKIWSFRLGRLQLLQFRDRLETFIEINMGRFVFQEYSKFRTVPLSETAVAIAESGKIVALNLLFKRHPYSLAPFILSIIAAIPETVPVQSYD